MINFPIISIIIKIKISKLEINDKCEKMTLKKLLRFTLQLVSTRVGSSMRTDILSPHRSSL